MAGIDILASVFNGANAAFLGDQYTPVGNRSNFHRSQFCRPVQRHQR